MDKTGLTGLVLYKRDQDHNCKFFEGEMMADQYQNGLVDGDDKNQAKDDDSRLQQ